jgi:hypothetical protein
MTKTANIALTGRTFECESRMVSAGGLIDLPLN